MQQGHETLKIGLGTVQFGQDYGISNPGGRVDAQAIADILALAADSGVGVIDTAALYGESERILGATLPVNRSFRIVTKTPTFKSIAPEDAPAQLTDAFFKSLDRLRQDRLYGLLVHHADDLTGPNGERLWAAMSDLKDRELVARIGVSVYTGAQIDRLLRRYPVDLVQLPMNVLDHRLIEGGQIARLAERGVEIHVRSVFLQGLLLMEPQALDARFEDVRDHLIRLRAAWHRAGLTPVEGALRDVLIRPEVDTVVAGVTRPAELEEIVTAAARAQSAAAPFPDGAFALSDPSVLDPSRWPDRPSPPGRCPG